MPALVAFNRRWQIASDDLVFPGVIDAFIRFSCLIASCAVYWKEERKLSCPGGEFLKSYLLGMFTILVFMIFSDIALVLNSMNGNIMDTEARKNVTPALYFRLLILVPEIGWTIMGTIWSYSKEILCTEAPETTLLIKGMIFLSWGLITMMILVSGLIFDPLGASKTTFSDLDYERLEATASASLHGNLRSRRVWERRCRVLFCSCWGQDDQSRDAFKEISKIMGFLFDDVDLVGSDLAAGLIILHMKNQTEPEKKLAEDDEVYPIQKEPSPSRFLQDSGGLFTAGGSSQDNWNSPEFISHFMKYALGSYGWPWFIVAHPKTGLCRLWSNLICCSCCLSPGRGGEVEGDNCCYCNTSALKDTTNIAEEDLLYASFQNDVFQTPFFIAVDHSTQSIVVAIRGTLSLRDAITDLTAHVKTLDSAHLPDDCTAHGGMLLAAKNVLEKMNSLEIFEKAFTMYPHYNLVFTGHSLGAGTAAIISVLLRSKYPKSRCYAYSPPGGLFSLEAAQYSESFITSIVIGDDIIPRLSVPTFYGFKNKIIDAVKSCQTPKYRILIGGCWYLLMGEVPVLKHEVDTQTEENSAGGGCRVPPPTAQQSLLAVNQGSPNYQTYVSLAEVSHQLQKESVTKCAMYPPGKIFYVTERPVVVSRQDLAQECNYDWRWANRTEFCEIKVTPKMMTHHYPDNVYRALKEVARFSIASNNAPNFV